jgi:hypothetical protein
MVIRRTKFSISIEKLQIEFEGSQEVGQQIQHGVQQALGGLMNAQARLLAMREQVAPTGDVRVIDAPVSDDGPVGANGNGTGTAANTDKPKQPRQRKASGASLTGLLRAMKAEGFFSQARSRGDTEARLKEKGHTFKSNNVAARLMELAQKNELFRKAIGEDGNYVYKDSPFDESSGSPNAGQQPSQ